MDTGIDQLGIQLHGLAVVAESLAPILVLLGNPSQVVVRRSRLGVDLQDILEFHGRLFVVLLLKIGLAAFEIFRLALLGAPATGQNGDDKEKNHRQAEFLFENEHSYPQLKRPVRGPNIH